MQRAATLLRGGEPGLAASPLETPKPFLGSRGWDVYLVIAALLVPVLKPGIPLVQATLVDAINFLGIAIFACIALARRPKFDVPLIGAIAVIAIGSLIATANAESFLKSGITMIQDTYLYLWFLALVGILKARGDRKLRVAWVWSANIAAAIALVLLLNDGSTTFFKIFGAKGNRAVGLFDGCNPLADFLMTSLFIVLSLSGQHNRLVLVGSFLFQLLGLLATKSIGAMSGFAAGLVVWAVLRALTRSGSFLGTAAVTLMLGGGVLLGGWVASETGHLGKLDVLEKASFVGRLDRSAEGRERIWHRLADRYFQSPLGIGPGNSSEQRLNIGNQERRLSQRSKEAHNDYLGYLVERGPLGLIGLVLLIVMPFVALWRGFRKVADRAWRSGPGGATVAALAGGLLATALHSFTMEKLHFRHFWMFLAIVYAIAVTPAPRLVMDMRRRKKARSRAASARRTGAMLAPPPPLRPESA